MAAPTATWRAHSSSVHRFSALPDNLPAKRTLLGNGMGDALPVVQHQFMGDLADAVALSDIEAFRAGVRITVFHVG